MKPFDLQAALNGAKVVTRDGREVKDITTNSRCYPYTVEGIISDYEFIKRWDEYGFFWDSTNPYDLDLFMAD